MVVVLTAYRFGLNEFKLKKGFKQFFKTTVFGIFFTFECKKQRSS